MMLHTQSLSELARGLASGAFSSVELTQYFLKRIQKFDGELNSFITVCEEYSTTV